MKLNKFKLLLATPLIMIFQFVNAINIDADNIYIEDSWVRSAPSNAPILGAFMTIHNQTWSDLRLVSATAENFQRVELHRTIKADGMMKMVKQEFIPIAAYNKLVLKPGSWHIMLIGPTSVPELGSIVPVVLVFDNGVVKNVELKVKKSNHSNHLNHLNH